MNVKQYLNQIRLLDMKINQRIEEKDSLLAKATSTGSAGNMDPNKVQSSADLHQTENLIVKYTDLEQEITQMIDRFITLKHDIIGEIQQLEDVKQMDCLYQKYVNYNSLEKIAENMNISVDYAFRVHRDALNEFRKVIDRKHSLK